MKLFKSMFFVLALAFVPAKSFAGFALPISLTYISDSTKVSSVTATSTRLGANISFGYILPAAPLYLGAMYDYEDLSGSNITGKYTQTGYGLTVGMMTQNLYLLANYILSAQYDSKDTGSTTVYKKGSGFLVRLGYGFDLGTITVGPEIAYRSIKYTERTSGSATTTVDITLDSILPYFNATFKF